MSCWLAGVMLLVAVGLFARPSRADEVPQVEVAVVATDLARPMAVVIRPASTALYVAEGGAGRIIRMDPTSGQRQPVIVDLPLGQCPLDPNAKLGPAAAVFVNNSLLLVGDGGLPAGQGKLRVFDVSDETAPLTPPDARATFGAAGTEIAGPFFGLAVMPSAAFATSQADAAKGWLLRGATSGAAGGAALSEFKPLAETSIDSGVAAPAALTISKRGEVLLGHWGKLDAARDGQLSFYNANTGKLLMSLPTGLHDVSGLAYHPKSGRLYALDLAWFDSAQGGLYRLDAALVDRKPGLKAVKIAAIARPTAMAFDGDGTLYITSLGDSAADEASQQPNVGKLLRLTGDL